MENTKLSVFLWIFYIYLLYRGKEMIHSETVNYLLTLAVQFN